MTKECKTCDNDGNHGACKACGEEGQQTGESYALWTRKHEDIIKSLADALGQVMAWQARCDRIRETRGTFSVVLPSLPQSVWEDARIALGMAKE
jgi:hypothetical protein